MEFEATKLTQAQNEALSAVFLEADIQNKGVIDVRLVPQLIKKLLGRRPHGLDFESVRLKSEAKSTKGIIQFADFEAIMTEAMAQTTNWGSLKTQVSGYVGIDTIQEQIRRKALKKGFEFNVMVVGASGLGKSTLVNSLFKAKISRRACATEEDRTPIIPKTVQIKSISHVIEEKSVKLKLTVTDTPGFGDHINNENCWLPIIEYINDQYEKYLCEEISVNRKRYIPDTRVHCCLYFIAPTGHSLKPIDIEFMSRLDKCVNIVPIIAKADTLTLDERTAFKKKIKEGLEQNNISIYPMKLLDEDEEDMVVNSNLRDKMPFAVVGSDKIYQVNGKPTLGRRTNWGLIEVENKVHCEFAHLRDMLIRTHMQDLKDVTDSAHYESFRRERLKGREKAVNGMEESRC
ncbi:neuronal-specific septin-3-like [Glandiceps talaboti]